MAAAVRPSGGRGAGEGGLRFGAVGVVDVVGLFGCTGLQLGCWLWVTGYLMFALGWVRACSGSGGGVGFGMLISGTDRGVRRSWDPLLGVFGGS